jgi:hypothetical protein
MNLPHSDLHVPQGRALCPFCTPREQPPPVDHLELRNLAISLLYLAGVKEVTRTLQAIARDRNRLLDYLPL